MQAAAPCYSQRHVLHIPLVQDLSDMLPMSPNVDMLLGGDQAGGSGDFWDPLGSLPVSEGQPPQQQQQQP